MNTFTAVALASLEPLATARTVYTGDTPFGYPVITSLDISDVPANTISCFWFTSAQAQGGGLSYILPIFVGRGTDASLANGRKLFLSASIHGDELNGIPVVQRVFASLNETVAGGDLNGTIIGIPTLNSNGNVLNQRMFFTSSSNGFWTNLKRVFPGESIADGGSVATEYAYNNDVWGNLSNVDIAVDLYTLSTDFNGPLWASADFRLPGVQRLPELAQPDIIKIDPGEPFVDNGIPAITLEIGPAKNWNQTLIALAEGFIYRLLNDLRVTSGDFAASQPMTVNLTGTYKATNVSYMSVTRSGWTRLDVQRLQYAEEGQEIGSVFNAWGDEMEKLVAPAAGRVLTVRVDPAVEAGAGVVDVVYNANASD